MNENIIKTESGFSRESFLKRDNNQIIKQVQEERARQDKKFGIQKRTLIEWIAILVEEVGETSKEAVDHNFRLGKHRKEYLNIVEEIEILKRYRGEMIQVAAVAIAALEDFDSQFNLDLDPTEIYWSKKTEQQEVDFSKGPSDFPYLTGPTCKNDNS